MKNFQEKEVKDLREVIGGVGEVLNNWKITGHVGKDDWNCVEVKVDFEYVIK
jgi:hypothetical protein